MRGCKEVTFMTAELKGQNTHSFLIRECFMVENASGLFATKPRECWGIHLEQTCAPIDFKEKRKKLGWMTNDKDHHFELEGMTPPPVQLHSANLSWLDGGDC